MRYDPTEGPPRSVQIQRRVEAVVEVVVEWFTPARSAALVVGLLVVHGLATTDPSTATEAETPALDAAVAFVESLTVRDVAFYLGVLAVVSVAYNIVIGVHEACHQAAFRYFGVDAGFTVNMHVVGGVQIPFLPAAGGMCWPEREHQAYRLSYIEDVVVSLAPLALSATLGTVVVGWNAVVSPVPAFEYVLVGVVLMSGPSLPDWFSLVRTPRARWDRLTELEQRLDEHRAVEGYSEVGQTEGST